MSSAKKAPKYLEKLRNIGIIAHIDAGKTTLTERILFYSKRIHRMGEVHDGTATMDYMPEEQERGITIASALTSCEWNGYDINIIDTPGHVDFTIEVERSLRVLDGAVGVFCAVGGVEPQSETVWRQSERYHVPKLAFINKMDRLGADFESVLESMAGRLRIKPLPIQVPDGDGRDFTGVFDVVTMERLEFDQDDQGITYERRPLTEDEAERVEPWRERLMETLAEEDDELLERYLGGEDISADDIWASMRRAVLELKLVPVLAGSALKNIGVQPLMDAVGRLLPGPLDVPRLKGVDPETKEEKSFPPDPKGPPAALVFKVTLESGRRMAIMRIYSGTVKAGETVYNATRGEDERVARLFKLHAGRKEKLESAKAGEITAAAGMRFARTGDTLCSKDNPILLEEISGYQPVISMAVEPRSADESDKLNEVLEKYLMEDPTLGLKNDEETGQVVLSGMGELHLEVILERLAREYSLTPRSGKPQVVYQETVTDKAEASEVFHRELGEDMHFGEVRLSVEPLKRGAGRDIRFEVDPEAFPEAWLEAVGEGVSDGLQSGTLKGYPVQDVQVRILDLVRKDSESSTVGYRMAATQALKSALKAAAPRLLEPIMDLEVTAPEDFIGEVVGLLGAKGAKVENMLDRSGFKVVQASAPLGGFFGFSTELRSATQGRASFTMSFSRFDTL